MLWWDKCYTLIIVNNFALNTWDAYLLSKSGIFLQMYEKHNLFIFS